MSAPAGVAVVVSVVALDVAVSDMLSSILSDVAAGCAEIPRLSGIARERRPRICFDYL
jgi:hypothetical protein